MKKKLTKKQKKELDRFLKKFIKEYGETIKMLDNQ